MNLHTDIKTGNERLLKLAELLDKLPPERFDFTKWVGENWAGATDLSCGTTACALGWATTIPEFRELGLRLVGGYLGSGGSVENKVSGYVAEDAAMELFGIDGKTADWLFIPAGTPDDGGLQPDASPQDVAAEIRKVVAERTAA